MSNRTVVYLFSGINELSINLTKISSIRMVKGNVLIDMDNGMIHVLETKDNRLYMALHNAFISGYVEENDNILYDGVEVSKIYVTYLGDTFN